MSQALAGQNSHPSALRVCWTHRVLLLALVGRDLKNRYAGSAAGLAWALLQPLAMLALYALVFEGIFKVKLPDMKLDQPYVLFVAVVLWPWQAFAESLVRGTGAIQAHAALVKKVAFEHELLVYSAVLSTFVVQSIGYVLVLSLLALWGMQLHAWGLLACLLLVPALMVLATALALMLSALQVFVRDVEQVLSQVLAVLFYATPILYPMSVAPGWLRQIMQFNPLAQLTEPLRQAWLGLGDGALQALWPQALWLWAGVLCAWWLARRVFLRLSPYFEDMV